MKFGFMAGKSITEAIFSLRQLIETQREGKEDIHLVFIERVPRIEVWNCLRQKVPKIILKYFRVCVYMYMHIMYEYVYKPM